MHANAIQVPEGMRQISKCAFFATVGQLNVHPNIISEWNDETGYMTDWTLQDETRRIVGRSLGVGPDNTYFVTDEFWHNNSKAILAAEGL